MPRFPNPSKFAESLSDSVFGALAKKARNQTGKVYPLHVGDTYLNPPAGAQAEAQRTTDVDRLHNYSPVQGEPVLLDAIEAKLRGRSERVPARSQLQVVSGATAGLTVVASAILEPGDEVILPSPFWPLIRGIIRARGAKAVEVPFFHRLGERDLNPAEMIRNAITDRTVAIYLNSPHNPTGKVLAEEDLEAIADVVVEHDLWVITDEAYEELWFTEERPRPIWGHPKLRDRAIVAHTLSKSYGFAGGRVGFLHGPLAIMHALRGMQTFTTYCASKPMQFGAAHALREGSEWVQTAKAAYKAAARKTAKTLGVPEPEGGTFLFFDARPHFEPGEDLLAFLSRCLDAGVLLTPGSASGEAFSEWARICFTSIGPEELELALQALSAVLKTEG